MNLEITIILTVSIALATFLWHYANNYKKRYQSTFKDYLDVKNQLSDISDKYYSSIKTSSVEIRRKYFIHSSYVNYQFCVHKDDENKEEFQRIVGNLSEFLFRNQSK